MHRQVTHGPLTFAKCGVRLLEIPEERPRPKHLEITLPTGELVTGDTLPMFSPSALSKWDDCNRKWTLYAVDKQTSEETAAQKLGTKLHAELEDWLSKGVPPSSDRLTDCDALSYFPLPNSEGMSVENIFVIECHDHDHGDNLYLWGFKDVEILLPHSYMCLDLKSTSSFDWKKSADTLSHDTQGCVYGLDGLLSGNYDEVTLRWVYVRTKGAPKCEITEVALTERQVLEVIEPLIADARAMALIKNTAKQLPQTGLVGLSIAPSPLACGMYRGCEYRHLCTDLKKGSIFKATRAQNKLAAQKHDARLGKQNTTGVTMSLLSRMKTTSAVGVATASRSSIGPRPTAPVAEAKPAPPPVAAAKPAPPPVAEAKPAAPQTPPAVAAVAKSTPATPGPLRTIRDAMEQAAAKRAAAQLELPTKINSEDAKPPPALPSEEVAAETEPEIEDASASTETQAPIEEAPKARRGRPPGSKNKSPASQAAPGSTIAPDPRQPSVPTSNDLLGPFGEAFLGGLVLLLNTVPVRGPSTNDIEDLIGPLRRKVEEEAAMPYRFIEFNKGPAIVAHELEQVIEGAIGVYTVDTRLIDKEVLEVLMRHAHLVLRGI